MEALTTRRTLLASLLGSLAVGIAACGGGGSDSAGTSSTTGSTSPDEGSVSVTPAMGAFGGGANGQAVPTGRYAARYRTDRVGWKGLGRNRRLHRPFHRAGARRTGRTGFQLTHAAAVQLVADLVAPRVAGTPSEAAQAFVKANARIQASVGIDPQAFDILTAPDALAEVTDRLTTQDTAPQAARYGAYLAALAMASTAPTLMEKTRLLAEDAAPDGTLEQHGTLIKETIAQLLTVRDTYTSGAAFGADLSAQVLAMRAAKPEQAMTEAAVRSGQSVPGAAAKPDQPATEAGAHWEARNSAAQTALASGTDLQNRDLLIRIGAAGASHFVIRSPWRRTTGLQALETPIRRSKKGPPPPGCPSARPRFGVRPACS